MTSLSYFLNNEVDNLKEIFAIFIICFVSVECVDIFKNHKIYLAHNLCRQKP